MPPTHRQCRSRRLVLSVLSVLRGVLGLLIGRVASRRTLAGLLERHVAVALSRAGGGDRLLLLSLIVSSDRPSVGRARRVRGRWRAAVSVPYGWASRPASGREVRAWGACGGSLFAGVG